MFCMNKAIFYAFAAILLLGCIQTGNEQIFYFDRNFVVQSKSTYISDNGWLAIKNVQITDSRCPEGVQCVWAGELGVTFDVSLPPSSISTDHAQIILGETTAKNKVALGYFFQLISVDPITKTATISV